MNVRAVGLLFLIGLLLVVPLANADSRLNDFGFMINGTFYYGFDPLPASFDLSGFDTATGYGSLVITLGSGNQNFTSIFDHDLSPLWNKNLAGSGGALGVGQSFELGSLTESDIVANFLSQSLTNALDAPGPGEHADWAMAMGFSYLATPKETSTISLMFTNTQPTSGFWLHKVGGDGDQVYMQGEFHIIGEEEPQIPEPATIALTAAGLLAIWLRRVKESATQMSK